MDRADYNRYRGTQGSWDREEWGQCRLFRAQKGLTTFTEVQKEE
jgi:hypothetical protein